MKKRKYIRISCSLLLALIFLLSGCGADKENNIKDASEAVTEDMAVEEVGEAEQYELQYTNLVLDRTKTEGKLAVYFLRGNAFWTTSLGGEHDGDSVLVITPDGVSMLYDCSTPNNGANIVYALKRLGVKKIDYFVNSHPHIDHMGGFPVVARNFEIGHVYTPAIDMTYVAGNNGRYWRKMMSMIDDLGIPNSNLQEGDSFLLGENVQVNVYNPPEGFNCTTAGVSENEVSLLLKLTYGESSYLMGGDIGNPKNSPTEDNLVAKYGSELHADIAKANHHMMPTQSGVNTDGWLATIAAKVWIGHMSTLPDDFEYFRFKQLDATILHTSLDGTVVVSTTGDGTYDIQMEREHPSGYGSLDAVDGYMKIE